MSTNRLPYRRRNSLRLTGYDYSLPGYYFVTTRVHPDFSGALGQLRGSAMVESDAAAIVRACWHDLPDQYAHVTLDSFVIVPDHVHGIIQLRPCDNDSPRHSLAEIVRAFKTFSSRRIRERGIAFQWHRGYYDRILRTDRALRVVRWYVACNPKRHALRAARKAASSPQPSFLRESRPTTQCA